MSADRITVAELIKQLQQFPPSLHVVSVHPELEDWPIEGQFDGCKVYRAKLYEVRSGWNFPESVGYSDEDYLEDFVVVSQFDEDIDRNWSSSAFEEINKRMKKLRKDGESEVKE